MDKNMMDHVNEIFEEVAISAFETAKEEVRNGGDPKVKITIEFPGREPKVLEAEMFAMIAGDRKIEIIDGKEAIAVESEIFLHGDTMTVNQLVLKLTEETKQIPKYEIDKDALRQALNKLRGIFNG